MFERKEKHLPLPPPLSTNKEITLQVLQNHHLLSQQLWRAYRITSSEVRPGTTMFVLTGTYGNSSVTTRVTFTNHDDGVSVLKQSKTGVSIFLRWSVTQEEYVGGQKGERGLADGFRQPTYLLEESFTIRGSRFIWWVSTIFQSHHLTTRCLMGVLADVATEETRKIHLNNELPLTDGKFKRA